LLQVPFREQSGPTALLTWECAFHS